MPDDVLDHINGCMSAGSREGKRFGRLVLGDREDYRLTRARRSWLKEQGISWKDMTDDISELERIGLLTATEAERERAKQQRRAERERVEPMELDT